MEEIKLTMASSHSSVVVGNGHEVVDGFCVVLVADVGPHVETSDRELDMCVQFVSPIPVVAKPLQTYHQNGGKHPKIKLFRCLLIFLTIWPDQLCQFVPLVTVFLKPVTKFRQRPSKKFERHV